MDFPLRILGYLLQNVRIGEAKLAINRQAFKNLPDVVDISSPNFQHNSTIPTDCTLYGENKSPAMSIKLKKQDAGEKEVKSFVLLIQDSDIPITQPATHLFAYGISPHNADFVLGELNEKSTTNKFKLGKGLLGYQGYFGPRPLPSHGTHKYHFQVFGLNETATQKLNEFSGIPSWGTMLEIIEGNVVGTGILLGVRKTE